uniref:Glycosyltransferase RgtA/B/C/D-like domain-containing protein n=1 Tax=candidate division WOR-3 bacterium TaxID=2052148 RepID=A0A7C4YRX5_UNCW3
MRKMVSFISSFVRKNKLLTILAILLIYYIFFIIRSSFVINGERYFTLFDDEMVSMRYAKNLANGYGLCWNKGERVEGITNLLWTIYISFFHLFSIPPSKVSLFIQLTGALFMLFSTFLAYRISYLIFKIERVAIISAIFLGLYYPVVYWSLFGTEVSILLLLTSLSTFIVLKNDEKKIYLVYLILGVSTLIRIDMVILYIGFWFYIMFSHKKNFLKHFFSGLTGLIIFVFGQTLFRYFYFRDILPNTYYLKMSGFPVFLRITRGLYVYVKFIWGLNILLVILAFVVLFYKRIKPVYFLLFISLLQSLYSIYVGGDAWEQFGGSNRFVSVVMFSFFILFSYSLVLIYREIKFIRKIPLFLYVIFSLLCFNSSYGPEANVEALLLIKPKYYNYNKNWTDIGINIKNVTNDSAKIAVVVAGTMAYFSDRYCIDILGKNDKYISHLKGRVLPGDNMFISFYPGHMKWDYNYSIGYLKPDIVVDLWYNRFEAENILEENYVLINFMNKYPLYFLKDSKNIFWEKLTYE